ncbi:phosphate ABC transporter permease subunit PstC [Candidatus Poribacteria bacterium]|nr:phosphate ABC transporter permease subunit PstC [Candidatus Poribacteria bacterium]MYH83336.1 phosphate ABC transporter permease subunit PstC [Candidatus Poribacteria bacterium]
MNFIQICFSFKGRINRTTWWMMQLLTLPIFIIASVITYNAYTVLSMPILITSVYLIPIVLILVLIWVSLAVTTKRLHDRDKSGWWLLINFIPIIAMFELGFIKGTRGDNRFGADSETSSETVIETLIRLCGFSCIIFVFGIFFFVFREGAGFLFNGLDLGQFLTSPEWYPTSLSNKRYGTFALILGTFSVTTLAMCIAVPFGLGAAIFVSEFCSPKLRETFKIIIELLAAIPSVVWGFIGLTLMNQLIIAVFNAPIGLTMLNGSIMLALMSVPIIVSIAEDALKAVPDSYREAAEALGATRWQVIYRVLLPAAKNGLLAAVLLGAARSIGETMAVLMATGHSVNIPSGPLSWIRTLTATIAAELGEVARGDEHYQVLFIIGVLLFTITFVVNLIADLVIKGIRQE